MAARPQRVGREAPVEPPPAPALSYVGLVTRAISFAIDAAVINLVALIVAAGAALIVTILHLPPKVQTVLTAIGAGLYVLWTLSYFVGFWSATGQTPGAVVMRIRVIGAGGEPVGTRRALVRGVGVVLAALPLFAGFVRVLFDDKRRAFQDRLAGTLVVDAVEPSPIPPRRADRPS